MKIAFAILTYTGTKYMSLLPKLFQRSQGVLKDENNVQSSTEMPWEWINLHDPGHVPANALKYVPAAVGKAISCSLKVTYHNSDSTVPLHAASCWSNLSAGHSERI